MPRPVSSSLTRRVSLILAGALTLVILALAGGLLYQQKQALLMPFHMPLPEQVAAITELVESAPPERLPLVLRALNSPGIEVLVSAQPPDLPADDTRLPGVSWIVNRYLEKLGDRVVSVRAGIPVAGDQTSGDRQLQLVIALHQGRYLVIRTREGVLRYLLWMRLVSSSILAFLVIGGGSLWLLRRQIRPVEEVARAVERFGESIAAQPVTEQGAPEIRGLAAAFNRMQLRIQRLMEGQSRMFGAISHDLGTYLTRLRLRVEYLPDPDQRERAIRDIEEMRSLMTDTLTLARVEHGPELNEPVDLARVIRRQIDAGAPIVLHPMAEAWVRGSETALGRAVSNLLANAVKYGGGAEVTLRKVGGRIELLVEDRGPGIPADARELVTEPFYRGDAARNLDAPGFGLGLAIVADIVRRHGGSLGLEDRMGGGLTARITLTMASNIE